MTRRPRTKAETAFAHAAGRLAVAVQRTLRYDKPSGEHLIVPSRVPDLVRALNDYDRVVIDEHLKRTRRKRR